MIIDIIRTAHYVLSAERGGADQPTLTAEDVLAQLEDRENSLVQVEEESNARLGTVGQIEDRTGGDGVNIYGPDAILA